MKVSKIHIFKRFLFPSKKCLLGFLPPPPQLIYNYMSSFIHYLPLLDSTVANTEVKLFIYREWKHS